METTRIVLRHDSTGNWEEVRDTAILYKGEPALEFTDDGNIKLKIGNGENVWKELSYFSAGIESSSGEAPSINFSNLTWGKLLDLDDNSAGISTEILQMYLMGYGDSPDIEKINKCFLILEEAISTLTKNQETFEETINTIAESFFEQDGRITDAEQKIAYLQEDIAAQDEAIGAHESSLISYESRFSELEESTVAIKVTLDETQTSLQEYSEKVEVNSNRVDNLINELTKEGEVEVPPELIDVRTDSTGNSYPTAGARVRAIDYKLQDLQDNMADYIGVTVPDGLIYEGNKLYLAANGEPICDPVEIVGGGGGGGGGGATYTVTLTNLLSGRIFSVTKEEVVILKYKYTSVDEDDYADGPGVGLLTVNGARKNSFSVPQGESELNITQYLSVGENTVALKVTNSEGSSRTLTYTVNVVALSLTTTFPTMGRYSGPVAFQYRVTGIGEKIAHFILDDREIGTETITANDVTRTLNIETQKDGSHFLAVYVESASDGVTVTSNTLNIGLMWYSKETVSPMVMINYDGEEKIQGEALSIPYLVYDPYHEVATITYNIYNEDGSLYLTTTGQVDDTGKTWDTQDYPSGQVKFEIVCEKVSSSVAISVEPSSFDSTIIQDGLALEFTAQNRSNYEKHPEQWSNHGYEATFKNFGWSGVDGWVTDEEGHAVLRFLPGGEMTIPFKPFDTDVRASGYTIEVELATHNVRDYDTTIITSYESGRGIVIKSQNATLTSEQSGVSVQFKEDSRVRITYVISQGGRRLIYVYINGILCGVTPYGETDNFKQSNPVGLTIGAENCGLDLYAMRFYNRAFTTLEQLNNFICDRSSISERIEADRRNDILDSENAQSKDSILLSYDKVKGQIPVMIMECPKLPSYKGDKKKGMRCEYIDQLNPEYSFTAENVEFDVQGTSSSVYPVKNFKIKIKEGITYTASGQAADGWLFDKDKSIETKTFCLKADYASSEHVNNAGLVQYYNTTNPYKMPPQEINPKVRQGVNGKPIMVFWRNSATGEMECQGCYNMNDDKSNEKTFGFVDTDITSIIPEPRIECWEWCNNNNALCLFKSAAAFDETKTDEDGKSYPAWEDDLEPRYPDLDDHVYGEHEGEIDAIRGAIEWVVSTDTTQVTNTELETPVKIPHYKTNLTTTFTVDNAEYRLSKFRNEFEEHFELEPVLFYYLFTELFLMIDNRAKNMFLTTFDGQHFFPIPYDFDTAIGINNEGALVFDYNLEDTDKVNNGKDNVFNGQESTLWINIRECYVSELRKMYQELRSNDSNPFSYEAVSEELNNRQDTWPEMAWNYDAQFKYLDPYDKGSNNLDMLQGNKRAQRDWWCYNAFKYRDSKYHAGEAASKFIILRVYNEGAITITPYSHIYARVQYGNAKDTTIRATRNEPVIFSTEGIDDLTDLETHIYSPDRIVDIGDLSSLHVGYCDVSEANKLQRLIIGNNSPDYSNGNLKTLEVGANELLREVNVANCYNLGTEKTKILNFTECPCLEKLDASGTVISSAEFSNGGRLREVHLPETIAALTFRNQPNVETLDIAGYDNISTIVLENMVSLDIEDLVTKAGKLDRVRIVGANWTATSEETLMATIDKLAACDGLTSDGQTTLVDAPVVTGRVSVAAISNESLQKINDLFPELVVVVDGVAKFFVRYNDWNNTLLYRYIADEGSSVIDPVAKGLIEAPRREDTEDTTSVWRGWSELPTSISKPYNIVAEYDNTYRVQFLDDDGNVINEQWINDGDAAIEPVEARYTIAPTRTPTAQYRYVWAGWDRDYTNITAPSDFKPIFEAIVQEYLIRYYNDLELLQETYVPYGSYSSYLGDASEIQKLISGKPSQYYTFIGWDKDPATTVITGLTDFHAQFYFDGYIEDSWAEIAQAAATGELSKYGVGGRKKITYTTSAGESEVEAEIVALKHDTLATTSSSYNSGAETATFTFILKDFGRDKRSYNETLKEVDGVANSATYSGNGWRTSDVRSWLSTVLLQALPADLQKVIKPVVKYSDGGFYDQNLKTTTDSIWLPSAEEMGFVSTDYVNGQGTAYPVYIDSESRKKGCDEDTSFRIYWLRTTTITSQHSACYVDAGGYLNARGGSMRAGVPFGFCI